MRPCLWPILSRRLAKRPLAWPISGHLNIASSCLLIARQPGSCIAVVENFVRRRERSVRCLCFTKRSFKSCWPKTCLHGFGTCKKFRGACSDLLGSIFFRPCGAGQRWPWPCPPWPRPWPWPWLPLSWPIAHGRMNPVVHGPANHGPHVHGPMGVAMATAMAKVACHGIARVFRFWRLCERKP